ncbi:sigma-70 family RNA polymerase sigma factor [Thermoproteota archaeon]
MKERGSSALIPETLIVEHKSIVEAIASGIAGRGNLPIGIEFEDLISWGIEGLIKAWKNYDPDKKTAFKTYAYYRIRGEMYDKIRSEWQYRNPVEFYEYRRRLRSRLVAMAEGALENTDALPGSDTKNKINSLIGNSAVAFMLSIEDLNVEPADQSVKHELDEHHFIIQEEIKNLDEEEKTIIEMLYKNDLKQKEAAAQLNWSKSKVCRVHIRALEKLRRRVKRQMKE